MTDWKNIYVLKKINLLIQHQLFKAGCVFLIPLVVSASVSYFVSVHSSRLSAQLASQDKTILDFQTDARSVDASIAAYAYSVIDDGAPNKTATQNLRQNLVEQYDEVDSIAPYVRPRYRQLIPRYKQELINMTNVLPNTTSVLNMKLYWETASKLLILRNQLTSNLPS